MRVLAMWSVFMLDLTHITSFYNHVSMISMDVQLFSHLDLFRAVQLILQEHRLTLPGQHAWVWYPRILSVS